MPDTFFSTPPHWTFWIIPYFYIGGIAGGALVLATLLQLFGRPEDRPLVRLGHYVALAGVSLCGMILIVDLHRPLRFWHMLIQSGTGKPMLKLYSPMSFGSWILLLFGLCAFLLALGAASEEGRLRWPPLRYLATGRLAALLAVAGAVLGFCLAGYTGVLVSATNRPIWADSTWLGVLFLFSGGSTAAATLIVLGDWRRVGPGTLQYLLSFDRMMLVLELLTLIVFLVSLGAAFRVLVSWWGVLLVLGTVIGIVVPLAIAFGRLRPMEHRHIALASLILVGALLIRIVVLLSSNSVHRDVVGVLRP